MTNNIELRSHQVEAYDAFDAGQRNQVINWGRRKGKDTYCLYRMFTEMNNNKDSTYYYVCDTNGTARVNIWEALERRGLLNHFAVECNGIENKCDDCMTLKLSNGSKLKCLSFDKVNWFDLGHERVNGICLSEVQTYETYGNMTDGSPCQAKKEMDSILSYCSLSGAWLIVNGDSVMRRGGYFSAANIKDNGWYVSVIED